MCGDGSEPSAKTDDAAWCCEVWRKPDNNTHSGAESQRGYNLDPVPVRILYSPAGRFETIEAVNHPAAQELVRKMNGEKGAGRHPYILDKCALQRRPLMLGI
jgi:hypothetical protein